jgi:hypothetical protein
MKVYTVLTIATAPNEGGNALDISKTAYSSRESAIVGLDKYTEVQPNLYERIDDDGTVFTVLVVEQTVEGSEDGI